VSFYKPNFIDSIVQTVPDYIIQSNPSSGGGVGGSILLSNATVTEGSSVGTVVGNFSVSGGSTRAYTFTLTSNPGGLFSVGGSTLAVAAGLTAGIDPITVRASDTGVSTINGSFSITVTSSAAAAFVPTYPYVGF
jgi:hypothetical protein